MQSHRPAEATAPAANEDCAAFEHVGLKHDHRLFSIAEILVHSYLVVRAWAR
jgi:hypothetical protein